jgi:hypothetical protein
MAGVIALIAIGAGVIITAATIGVTTVTGDKRIVANFWRIA